MSIAPAALDYLVRTCLAKDPDARFQTAHDLLLQLKWIAGEGSTVSGQGSASGVASAPAVGPQRSGGRLAWSVASVCGLGLLAEHQVAVALVGVGLLRVGVDDNQAGEDGLRPSEQGVLVEEI